MAAAGPAAPSAGLTGVLPQLRHVYHFSWSDRGPGEPPLAVPLVVLLHPADAAPLSGNLTGVVEEVLGLLQLHGSGILPRVHGGAGPGVVLDGPVAAQHGGGGGATLVFHGASTSVRFSVDVSESASRYALLSRNSVPGQASAPAGGGVAAAAAGAAPAPPPPSQQQLLQGALYSGPSVAPFAVVAAVQHKRRAAERRRAAALVADPGLAPFLPPLAPTQQ